MAGVYSVKFISGKFTPGTTYTVPPGKRAIIKSGVVCNDTAGAVSGGFYAGGAYAWEGSVPGHSNANNHGMHLVANAGETIGVTANSPGLYFHIAGYLLDAT